MKRFCLIFTGILTLVLTACAPKWAFTVEPSLDEAFQVDKNLLESYGDLMVEGDSKCEGIPLEIVLYQNGIEVIETIEVTDIDGGITSIGSKDLIDGVCVSEEGDILLGENVVHPNTVEVNEHDLVMDARKIQDIPATTVSALGLEMDDVVGTALVEETYKHVALIFLDGFSYDTYSQSVDENLIPNIQADSSVFRAVSVYPPRTTTASAALLTGLTPNESGVNKSGIRSTEARTIFDAAAEQGLTSIAIEGESMSFNIRNTTAVLSGDRDNNGGTDDNTFANAMEALDETIPDLIWIHFHGIDDLGHQYGPNTDEVLDKVVEIDAYVGEICEILPENTLIIIFSDHGMHYEKEEEEFGNHGNLINDDMVIPIIIKTK